MGADIPLNIFVCVPHKKFLQFWNDMRRANDERIVYFWVETDTFNAYVS